MSQQRRDRLLLQLQGWDRIIRPSAMLGDHWDMGDGVLTDFDLVTWEVLVSFGRKNGRVFAKRETIAERRGCQKRALQQSISRLIEAGWVDRARIKRGGKWLDGFDVRRTKRVAAADKGVQNSAPCTVMHPNAVGGARACTPGVHDGAPMEEEVHEEEIPSERGEPVSQARQASPPSQLQGDEVAEEDQGSGEGGNEPSEDAGGREIDGVWLTADDARLHDELPTQALRAKFLASKRGKRAAPVTNGKDSAANEPFTPPPTDFPEHTWPPEGSRDIYYKWGEEVRARHPGYRVPYMKESRGRDASICKKLGEKYEHDALLHIMRIAVWDWPAIQETIDPWYTKEAGPVPLPQHIAKLAPQLSARIGKGVTSTSHRVSEYRSRYVTGSADQSSSVDESGLSFAERMRRRRG